jgi:hypothetical protein
MHICEIKNLGVTLIATFIWCAIPIISGCRSDSCSRHSNTDSEAIKELVAKGWVPENIPKSSYDINECHDLDTNTGKGSFKFVIGREGDYLSKMKPFTAVDEGDVRIRLGLTEAWRVFRIGNFVIGVNFQTGSGIWRCELRTR